MFVVVGPSSGGHIKGLETYIIVIKRQKWSSLDVRAYKKGLNMTMVMI